VWLLVGAGYGPLDQGAFNQFYEQEIRGKPINKVCLAAGFERHAGYKHDRKGHTFDEQARWISACPAAAGL